MSHIGAAFVIFLDNVTDADVRAQKTTTIAMQSFFSGAGGDHKQSKKDIIKAYYGRNMWLSFLVFMQRVVQTRVRTKERAEWSQPPAERCATADARSRGRTAASVSDSRAAVGTDVQCV